MAAATATTISDIDYWTEQCAIDQILLRLASIKEPITYQGKTLMAPKYYHQAIVLKKYIAIAKPTPCFVIHLRDLTPEIITQLRLMEDQQLVLKQAVGRIFENLDFRLYHLSIAKVLEVELQ